MPRINRPGSSFGRFCVTYSVLLLTLLLCACGAKKELPSPSPARGDAPVTGAITAQAARPEQARQLPTAQRTAPKAKKAAGDKSKTVQAEKARPALQMLESAGRNPNAAQPEDGFLLSVPDAVRDGEAFAVSFAAKGARQATFVWRGKSLKVNHLPGKPETFQALLPVPLDEKSESLPLALTIVWADGGKDTFSANLPVKKRRYPVQRLTVDSKFVTPPPEVQDKIKKDRAEMRTAISGLTPHCYWKLPMLRPVPGEVTSLYGMRRVFNGKPKNPHKGVDFSARTGAPVAAIDDGVAVLVSDHYYGGKTVVIDHGLGVMSAYLHLSAFNVKEGEQVSRGSTIGLIGATGRVTGPHLHLSLYVLGEGVDAATCLDM